MKRLPALAAVCLLILSSVATAQQISPHPNPSGNTINISGDATNNLSFQNNGAIDIQSGGYLENLDSGNLISSGWLDNSGYLENSGGQIEITDTGVLGNYPGGFLSNRGTLKNQGSLNNQGVFFIYETAVMNNHGKLYNEYVAPSALQQVTHLGIFGTLNNYGWLSNTGLLDNNSGTLINHQGATVHNGSETGSEGSAYMQNTSRIENFGTFINFARFETGNSFLNHSVLINESGGTLSVDETIDNTDGTFTNRGTLKGGGTILGGYTDHGVISPGQSAGVLTIVGHLVKAEGSKTIELGGLSDGDGDKSLTEYDLLDVTGNVELAGTLDVLLIDGFELVEGMSFNFLRVGGTLIGEYDGLSEGALVGQFGGEDLFITYAAGDGNDVGLFTKAVPGPNVSPRCEAAMDRAAGHYSQCLLLADAHYARHGNPTKLANRQARCETRFDHRTSRAINRHGADACPSSDLVAAMEDRTVTYAQGAASEAGGTPAPSLLFVQNGTGGTLSDTTLTLTDVSSQTVWFTDRPYRGSGQMSTEKFIALWDEGETFADDPPNADFTCTVDSEVVNYVVELTSPAMPGDDLSYSVNAVGETVLPEAPVACEAESHLLIDNVTPAGPCVSMATGGGCHEEYPIQWCYRGVACFCCK